MRLRKLFSLSIPFTLAVVLAFGSVGFASSHQSAVGTDRYVICTGYGLVTITVDENGNRVAEGVPCPDSIALSAALPSLAQNLAFEHLALPGVSPGRTQTLHLFQVTDAWRDARAPPVPDLA